MSFHPNGTDAIRPGIKGRSAQWGILGDNHNELYSLYSPPIVYQASFEGSPLVSTIMNESYQALLRWVVPRDLDNVSITIEVLWRCLGDSATIQIECNGATEEDSLIPDSWAVSRLQMIPGGSTGAAPLLAREFVLKGKADTSTDTTIEILSVVAYYDLDSSIPSGVQDSGWCRVPALMDTANRPIPSELVSRMVNGPVFIAKDRPVAVFSLLDSLLDIERGDGRWQTASSVFAPIIHFRMQRNAEMASTMRYGFALYLPEDETQVRIILDGQVLDFTTSPGWSYGTMTVTGNEEINGEIQMKTTDTESPSPDRALGTLQIFRIGEVD